MEWKDIIGGEKQKPYFQHILQYVEQRRKEGVVVYPPAPDVFNAFKLTSLEQTKIVILGQDPYHGKGQAHGLAFSVEDNQPFPPSLKNIFKELESDQGTQIPMTGNLSHWARQGVLLLNTVLTVQESKANSHRGIGWEKLTDQIIQVINDQCVNVVFILWGKPAQKKADNINETKHCVLRSAHPSPLSSYRGFFGSRPFSKTNEYLKSNGKPVIQW